MNTRENALSSPREYVACRFRKWTKKERKKDRFWDARVVHECWRCDVTRKKKVSRKSYWKKNRFLNRMTRTSPARHACISQARARYRNNRSLLFSLVRRHRFNVANFVTMYMKLRICWNIKMISWWVLGLFSGCFPQVIKSSPQAGHRLSLRHSCLN